MMQQLMLEAAATSAPPMSISTYHARDDVMLLALHRAVPPEREIASTWRCPSSTWSSASLARGTRG